MIIFVKSTDDMKKLFFAAFIAMMLSACGRTPEGACVIEGNVSLPEYGMMYLVGFDGTRIDSTSRADDGGFRFVYADSTSMPEVVVLEFRNPSVAADVMYLPVALEPGHVNVTLGEYIGLSGTPLNDEIKEFFDEMQALSDSFETEISTVEGMKAAYSAFYLRKMQENDGNVFGDYLKLAYARELTVEDLEKLLGE